jgi:Protein of unknown function (DUF3551)
VCYDGVSAKEDSMRIVAMTAILVVTLLAAAGTRHAQAAPWCAWYNAYARDCGYYTFEQCLATIRGVGGYCARNVYDYATPYQPRRDKRHRRYD